MSQALLLDAAGNEIVRDQKTERKVQPVAMVLRVEGFGHPIRFPIESFGIQNNTYVCHLQDGSGPQRYEVVLTNSLDGCTIKRIT